VTATLATVLVLAHFGHWYISLPTYMTPVILIAGWAKWNDYKERKQKRKVKAGTKARVGARHPRGKRS
jgi:hypothetical protein